jgi:hypothetical protein
LLTSWWSLTKRTGSASGSISQRYGSGFGSSTLIVGWVGVGRDSGKNDSKKEWSSLLHHKYVLPVAHRHTPSNA